MDMDKKKFPREGLKNQDDGLGQDSTTGDVEGHAKNTEDRLAPHGPGTGGDAFPRRPSSGGELIDENDGEGHARFAPQMPGTGGDAVPRQPSSGGELIDENDVEGHHIT
jgi:hypothetical protein